tara:strand:+ start:296 stop:1027 length:732 start_codon:yes stop_codon:yes gene_type:complete
MKSVHIFSDTTAMAEEIAHGLYEQSKRAAEKQHVFSIVLSGGSTATALYGILALPKWRDRIPWKSIHIFFADERCVPPNNTESNYKIICDHLINKISIPKANIHRIQGEENPEKESLRYAKEIKNHSTLRKENINFFDWVFLGIGIDGHIASLFPDQNIINSPKLCEVAQHPDTGQNRITMTLLALKNSTRVTYHVIGKKKSKIVSEITSNFSSRLIYPASQIKGELFLDKHAASKIDNSGVG